MAEGADQALSQALINLRGRAQPLCQPVKVSTRVLVVGSGLIALTAARQLSRAGYQVLLLTPGKRLAPPEPLWGEAARESAWSLAEELKSDPSVELVRQGRLLSLLGSAGAFQALMQDGQGELLEREAGAVLVAQGPPLELNWPSPSPGDHPRVVSLEDLAGLVAAPQHLAKITGRKNPRVGLAVGLDRQAGPRELRCALETGRRLVAEHGAAVTLFTGNLKVASRGLEAMSQEVRGEGVLLVKLTDTVPKVTVGEETIGLQWRDEVLQREISQEFELLAVDQRPAPDRAYARLAEALRLGGVTSDGRLQPDRVNALPSASVRGGVYLVGDAAGARDLDPALDQAAEALWRVGRLLGSGEVPAPAGLVSVDRKRCALCLTCVRVCPHGAMDRAERRPFANPLACQACGTCAAECPMDAIQVLGCEDDRYRRQVQAAVTRVSSLNPQEPPLEMLVVACTNSAVPALGAARMAGGVWPEGVRLLEVPCAGKIDPEMVLGAFREGMDGVLVLTCHPHACYSLEGNTWAGYRLEHLRGLLDEAGLEAQRLMTAAGAAAMGREVLAQVEAGLAEVTRLGPSPLKIGARVRDLLAPFTRAVDEHYTLLS